MKTTQLKPKRLLCWLVLYCGLFPLAANGQLPALEVSGNISVAGPNAVLTLQLKNLGPGAADFGLGGATIELNGAINCVGVGGTSFAGLTNGAALPDNSGNSVSVTKQGTNQLVAIIDGPTIGTLPAGDSVTIAEVPFEILPAGCSCPVPFQINASVSTPFFDSGLAPYSSVSTSNLNPSAPQSLSNSITAPAPLPAGPQRAGTLLQLQSAFPATWVVNSPTAGSAYQSAPQGDQAQFVFYSEASTNETQSILLVNGPCVVSTPLEIAPSRKVRAKALLGGPYNGTTGEMDTKLNPTANNVYLLDTVYRFGSTNFNNYDGQRMSEFATVPPDAVDIVRVAVRPDNMSVNAQDRVAVGYGWLLADGDIVDFYSGGELDFINLQAGNISFNLSDMAYVSVHHRTHLPVRNETPVAQAEVDFAVPAPSAVFDYSNSSSPDISVNGTVVGGLVPGIGYPFAPATTPNSGRVWGTNTPTPGNVLMIPGNTFDDLAGTPPTRAETNAMDWFYVNFAQAGSIFVPPSFSTVSVGANPQDLYNCAQDGSATWSQDVNLDGTVNATDVAITLYSNNNLFNSTSVPQNP